MRSLGTRRAALVAGAATVAALALGGCSAGQVAETAILDTPIAGVNSQSKSGSVLIRNLQVEYNGVEGYALGESAPLELSLYNQTSEPVTVTITPQLLTERPQVVEAEQVGFVSTTTVTTPGQVEASTDPSAETSTGPSTEPGSGVPSAEPTATIEPARIEIGPQGSALFRPTDTRQLQITGLQEELKPGMAVSLTFEFSNGDDKLQLAAPVASPLTPAPRGSAEINEESEGGH